MRPTLLAISALLVPFIWGYAVDRAMEWIWPTNDRGYDDHSRDKSSGSRTSKDLCDYEI